MVITKITYRAQQFTGTFEKRAPGDISQLNCRELAQAITFHNFNVYSTSIKFKIILLTHMHKALHQQSPIYIQDLIRRYSTSRTLRSSYAFRLCHVNYNLKSYGSRAFAVSAPELWNKLPIDIRSCDNLNLFKRKLKTHLYSNYFKQI